MLLAPWQIRNASAFDSFAPVSTKLGLGLAGSYNEAVRADPDHAWAPPHQLAELRPVLYGTDLDEAEVSRELQRRALDFVGDHPGYPFELAAHNLLRIISPGATAPGNADAELVGLNGDAGDDGLFLGAWWLGAAAARVPLGVGAARRSLAGLHRGRAAVPAAGRSGAILAAARSLLVVGCWLLGRPASVYRLGTGLCRTTNNEHE